MELFKRCPDCRRDLPITDFGQNRKLKDGLQFYCKTCCSRRGARTYRERQARRGRTVRERVPVAAGEKYCPACRRVSPLSNWHRNAASKDGYVGYCKDCRKEQARAGHLRRTFGLSVQEAQALVDAQGGLCAICRKAPVKHLDHDHQTGALRGALCGPCNMGLGQFRDDPDLLVAASRYLRRHRRIDWVAAVDGVFTASRSTFEIALRRHLAA